MSPGDEPELFRPAQLFDGRLPAEGGGLVHCLLPVDQHRRKAGTGVLGALSAVVDGQAALHIGGGAGVQRAVGTAEDIDVINSGSPLKKGRSGDPERPFEWKNRLFT